MRVYSATSATSGDYVGRAFIQARDNSSETWRACTAPAVVVANVRRLQDAMEQQLGRKLDDVFVATDEVESGYLRQLRAELRCYIITWISSARERYVSSCFLRRCDPFDRLVRCRGWPANIITIICCVFGVVRARCFCPYNVRPHLLQTSPNPHRMKYTIKKIIKHTANMIKTKRICLAV